MDVFDEVRRLVHMGEACEHYGIRVNPQHKALCIWHTDRRPSMHIYSDHVHCFSCGAGGSIVDVVMQLFGLSPLDAVRRLDADFRLGLPFDDKRPTDSAEAQERQRVRDTRSDYEAWRDGFIKRLCAVHRVGHAAGMMAAELTEAQALALRWREAVEYWLDTLQFGTMTEQMAIFRDRQEVERLCKKILQDTPTRSRVA